MKLTEEKILSNYNELIEVIEKYITGERKEKLLSMYEKIADRVAVAPASSINTFHGCYSGGYLNHVLSVIDNSISMYNLWKSSGADTSDYTLEELVFSALNHDLGKVGDMEHEYYIPNTSEWHVKNQGRVYVDNPEIVNMTIPDRSLWMLQNAGISITQNEFLAIKLHDGPIVEDNRSYFTTFQEHRKFRTNMIYILHQADEMAARIEFEREHKERKETPVIPVQKQYTQKNKLSESVATQSATDLFSKMFDSKKE